MGRVSRPNSKARSDGGASFTSNSSFLRRDGKMCKQACVPCRDAKQKCERQGAVCGCCLRCDVVEGRSTKSAPAPAPKLKSKPATTRRVDESLKAATKKEAAAEKKAAISRTASAAQAAHSESATPPVALEEQATSLDGSSPSPPRGLSFRRIGTSPLVSCSESSWSSSSDLEESSPEFSSIALPTLAPTIESAERKVFKWRLPGETHWQRDSSFSSAISPVRGVAIRKIVLHHETLEPTFGFYRSYNDIAAMSNARNDEADEPVYGRLRRIEVGDMIHNQ